MKTNLVDFVLSGIPGIRVLEDESVGQTWKAVMQLGTGKVLNMHQGSFEFLGLKRSWERCMTEDKVEWYLSGGYKGDYLHLWMRHLLLCHLGRNKEAVAFLRGLADDNYRHLTEGLPSDTTPEK